MTLASDEMPDTNGIERIVGAMRAVRPDWRADSLRTFLTSHHADRPFRDLLIAAVAVASDERTLTPHLLNEHGPWWVAAYQASRQSTPTVGPGREPRCDVEGHEHELARACRCCAADRKGEA